MLAADLGRRHAGLLLPQHAGDRFETAGSYSYTADFVVMPPPAPVLRLGTGLAGLGWLARRRALAGRHDVAG